MKINNKLFFLGNKKGSLVTNLIAAGILGLSGTIMVQYISGVSGSLDKKTFQSDMSFNIHTSVINNLQSLLIETKIDNMGEPTPNSSWGICSLLSPVKKTHGVTDVKLRISSQLSPQVAVDSFSLERWQHFFPQSEYTIVNDGVCKQIVDPNFQSSPFSRCLKYMGAMTQKNVDVYIVARIVPKKFPDRSELNMTEVTKIDAKRVIFELQALVGVDQKQTDNSGVSSRANTTNISKHYAIVWANDITECNMKIQNQWISVQFSGSGVGRLRESLVINSSFFSAQDQCSEVQFGDMPANVIIVGQKIQTTNSIEADFSKNVRMSCRKNVYRCPGTTSPSSDYDPISFGVGVFNDSGGNLSFNSFDFTVLNKEDREIDSSENKKLDTLSVNIDNDSGVDFSGNNILDPMQKLNTGHNFFNFSLTNPDNNAGALAQICNRVCAGDTFYPSLTMNFSSPPDKSCVYSRTYNKKTDHDKYRFRCTVCHSKAMCRKVSLGAFGPIRDDEGVQGLTDEPLDGNIPECRINNLTPKDYALPKVSDGKGSCVAMKIDNIDSFKNFKTANYEYRKCGENLPVLCFAYGHYFPAVSVRSHVSEPEIFRGNYAQAQKACYDLAREIILKNNMAEFFKNDWGSIADRTNEQVTGDISSFGINDFSSSDNHFDYINNASRGIFIAPSYNISALSRRLSEGSNSYLQKTLARYNRIWVAMEKDGGGQLIGSIPQANVADSPFALFNRKEPPSRPILLRDTTPPISNSGQGVVVTHNIRYKGVYQVPVAGKRWAFCRKGNGHFVFSDNTTLKNASNACRNKGAYFVPPLSSMEWVKVLTLLANNDEMYPFPNPGDFSDPSTPEGAERADAYQALLSVPAPTAWVALNWKSGDRYRASSWRLNKEAHFQDNKSIFRTEVIPSVGKHYIGVIDYKGKPIVSSPSLVNRKWKVCARKDNYGQVTDLKTVSMKTSCKKQLGNSWRRINDKNFRYYLKSIKFMSLWVQKFKSGLFVINDKAMSKINCKRLCNNKRGGFYNSCRSGCTSCKTTYIRDGREEINTCHVNDSCRNRCVQNKYKTCVRNCKGS